ncbi:ABC transporter ATP-binding protein [Natronomonas sp. EA1]|uniref:ABC transporter ATP-binding protein n=1 Tax=Natronomonas sp. EA1 TaxID=3421655 RepID=UPI003EBC4DB9
MTDVTLTNVRKAFGDVVAVKDISLTVPDGEFVVVVGPSGCGKSTTLRLIAGLESVTEGDIRMGGESVVGIDGADRDVAMVFQNYALYPHMTARRNITFGMRSSGSFTDAEVASRVEEAAEVLDIADLLDRKPAALSGGERQRVALGRAIVRDPKVFLMDEPLSNLDAKLRIRMRAELAKLHARLGTTTVYVTHDQTEAMTLGDRVVVMYDGEIQQTAPPQRLYDYPANRFVAEFIGDPAMNVFPVEVRRDGGAYRAGRGALQVALPADDSLTSLAGREALLGVRPENLHVEPRRGPETVEATVTVTEPLGDSLLIECAVGDVALKVHASPRSGIEPGDTVFLSADAARLHLFDPETGEARYHSDPEAPVTGMAAATSSASGE